MKAIEADVLSVGFPTSKPPSHDTVCKALDDLLRLRQDAVEVYRTLRPIFHGAYRKKHSIRALRAAVGVIYDDLKLLIDNRRKSWETENLRQIAERDTHVASGGTVFDSGALYLMPRWPWCIISVYPSRPSFCKWLHACQTSPSACRPHDSGV